MDAERLYDEWVDAINEHRWTDAAEAAEQLLYLLDTLGRIPVRWEREVAVLEECERGHEHRVAHYAHALESSLEDARELPIGPWAGA